MSSSNLRPSAGPDPRIEALQEEIALLEARLRSMGLDGDCAYERALSQVYAGLLETRRQQLAAMRVAGF